LRDSVLSSQNQCERDGEKSAQRSYAASKEFEPQRRRGAEKKNTKSYQPPMNTDKTKTQTPVFSYLIGVHRRSSVVDNSSLRLRASAVKNLV
jgi:hypothetical protein